jgi:transcriptional regulator with XRE-family HTH domain
MKLKELREEKRMSQRDLCRLVGVSQPFLCDLEHGRRNATLNTWKKIADALDVPITELIEKAE